MKMITSGGKVLGHDRFYDRTVDSAPGLEEDDDPRHRLREHTLPTQHYNNEWRVRKTFSITEHDPATKETRRTNYP